MPKIGPEWLKYETWREYLDGLGFEYVIDPKSNRRQESVWARGDIKVRFSEGKVHTNGVKELPSILIYSTPNEAHYLLLKEQFLCMCPFSLSGANTTVFDELMLVLNGIVEPKKLLTCVGITWAAPVLEHILGDKENK